MSTQSKQTPSGLPGRTAKRSFAKSCLLPVIGLGIIALCLIAFILGYFLQTPPAKPSVLIHSPRNGERLAVGQEIIVQAIARGDTGRKIKRVELWIDDKLIDAQNSELAGGISPFPLVISWRIPSSGVHTLIVRAFDTQHGRSHASIGVETIANTDRDYDSVPDAIDACPDQPGTPMNRGCPAPSADDRDGDGVANASDACPDQPGSIFAEGCPDADGDRVRDSVDACPREFGVPAGNGCPSPTDTDNDGLPNTADRCPNDPGPMETNGCPARAEIIDRDGDGVRDSQDLCPTVPGPASNSGCPPTGTGDRDGDGVDDATDLAPTEPGRADGGGVPPPGGGMDRDGDGIADDEESSRSADESIPDGGGWEAINVVRIDALEFSVTQDYDEVYCYVTSQGIAERFGPFDLLETKHWDIAEYMGGANSRTIAVPVGHTLRLHVECNGYYPADDAFSIAPADLGSITRSYAQDQWDGHVITERSGATVEERGTAGHSFEVKFRLCFRSCESSTFPAPVLRRSRISIGPWISIPHLEWNFSGNESDISGYHLYINGNRRDSIPAFLPNRARLSRYDPPCGDTYEYYVTAYRARADGFNDRESPPSNVITVEGDACPRRVRVRFTQMSIDTLGPDIAGYGGPYYGSFWATGNRQEQLDFRQGSCRFALVFTYCRSSSIHDYAMSGSIAHMFEVIRADAASNRDLNGWHVYAPEVDYVIVEAGSRDDLTIGAIVKDDDGPMRDDVYFNAARTISAGFGLPFDLTLASGSNRIIVRVELVGGP